MKLRYHWIVCVALLVLLTGCATKQDFDRLESKVDQLIQATNRSTMDEIFGDQASQISMMVNDLGVQQKARFDSLQQEYANGTIAVKDVREKMLSVLGNNDRVVSTRRGIYIRDVDGTKLKAIPNETKIANCHLLADASVPLAIQQKSVLKNFSWGRGELNGKTILFPWELTISAFTKEVAEHTAMRTAQEFIRMGGEAKWKRPIRIQISTEKDDQIKVSTNEEDSEIYVEYENVPETPGDDDTAAAETETLPETTPGAESQSVN